MTLTLFLGGICTFVLALLLARSTASAVQGSAWLKGGFALIWLIVALAMLTFVKWEGLATEASGSNGVRLAGQTRIAVLEAGIELDDDLAEVRFGGDAERDDIILEGYPSRTLVARRNDAFAEIEVGETRRGNEFIAVFADGQRVSGRPLQLTERETKIEIALLDEAPLPDLSYEAVREEISEKYILVRPNGGWIVRFLEPENFIIPPGNIRPASADTSNQRRDGDNVTPFHSLGSRFDPSFDNTELILPNPMGRQTLVRGREGGRPYLNSAVRIEQSGYLTVLRVDPLNITAGLRGVAWPAMFWMIFLSFVLSARMRMRDPLIAAILGIAELLLLIRILMAIEGGMVTETLRSRQALSDALLALPLGLMVMHAALQSLGVRLVLAFAAFLVSAVIIAVTIQQNGSGALEDSNWFVMVLSGMLTGVTLLVRTNIGKLVGRIEALGHWSDERFYPWLGSLWNPFGKIGTVASGWLGAWARPVSQTAAVGMLIVLLKVFFLVVLDESERFFVAFSVLFVPLTLFAFLPLFLHLMRSRDRLVMGGFAFLASLGVFVVATQIVLTPLLGWVVRQVGWTSKVFGGDVGLGIVLSLALSITAAVVWLMRHDKTTWITWVAVGSLWLGAVMCLAQWLAGNSNVLSWAIPIALVLIGAALVYVGRTDERLASAFWLGGISGFAALILVTSLPALQPKMDSPPDSASDLAVNSRSVIRLTSALAPERMGFLTSKAARENRDSIEDIAQYGKTAGGYGFLNVPNIESGVVKQQFSDFAMAVHFVFPFGRLAAVGLVLLIGSFSVLAFARLQKRAGLRLFGVLAASTFAFTCVYITLTNLLLAPVTGRNFYLLAPQSHSDLLEGLMLLSAAAIFLLAKPVQAGRRA